MQLHLSGHVLPIEMRIPPAPLILIARRRPRSIRPYKRNPEIPLTVLNHGGFLGQFGRLCRLHHGTWGTFILIHGGAFAILRLPRVVHFQTTMEFMATGLQREICRGKVKIKNTVNKCTQFSFKTLVCYLKKLNITGCVDGVA